MGLLECASYASCWRGYDYYEEHKVFDLQETAPGIYSAAVQGTAAVPYTVELNLPHPRKSSCNCPHANGRRVICKHIVAAYFAALPKEAVRFYKEAMDAEEMAAQDAEDMENKVSAYIMKMKKAELQEALLETLSEGPEWLYDRFIREHGLDYD